MSWHDRIKSYNEATGFPCSLFVAGDGRVVGTWIMGNDYRVASGYYGGYPAGYLRRIKALFPDKLRVLHVFSGKVDLAAMPGDTVDCNSAVHPTWVAVLTISHPFRWRHTILFWPIRHIAWKTPSVIKRRW